MQFELPDVLVVDDEPEIRSMICDGLADTGFRCHTASTGAQARSMMERRRSFSVLVADIALPDTTGLNLLVYARRAMPQCKVILITGLSSTQHLVDALNMGAYDYLEKPFDICELAQTVERAAADATSFRRLPLRAAEAMRQQAEVRRVSLEAIGAMVKAVEAKDPYTRRHSEQVVHYAVHFGKCLDLDEQSLERLRVASLLHDIGKIGIPDSILVKPDSLTDREFDFIRQHPALGEEILRHISAFAAESVLVRAHHERWDGRGYPDGTAGEEIPLEARIINLADSIDAMLMKRTYKDAYSVERMLAELESSSGTQFDPQLAQVAIRWCRQNPERLILPPVN